MWSTILNPNAVAETAARLGTATDDDKGAVLVATAADMLLELGITNEHDPELALEATGPLDPVGRRALLVVAWAEAESDLDHLERFVRDLPSGWAAGYVPPPLATDPRQAEALQRATVEALLDRERVHRLLAAVDVLAGEEPSLLDESRLERARERLAPCDARLRDLVPHLSVLAPERSLHAARLPDPRSPEHWWLTEASAPADAEDAEDSRPVSAGADLRWFTDWLAHRATGPEAVLQLDRDEARALLATPRGQVLAEWLGDRLDLDAGRPTEAEMTAALGGLTVSQALAEEYAQRPAPVDSRRGEGLAARVRRALGQRWQELCDLVVVTTRPQAAFATAHAATAPPTPVLGLRALGHFVCEAATVVTQLGVVASGWNVPEGDSRPGDRAWLVVPRPEIARLALEPGGPWVARDAWTPGGVQWRAPAGTSAALDLWLAMTVTGDEDIERRHVECGAPDAGAALEPLTVLLRFAGSGLNDRARECWRTIQVECDDESRADLVGLATAMEAMLVDGW